MEHRGVSYETILHHDKLSPHMQRCLPQIRVVFESLDGLAALADGEDDRLMELANALADTMRGSLVSLYGIDIRPVSEIGPYEEIDLSHALQILSSVASNVAPSPKTTSRLNESDCAALRESVLLLERDLNRVQECLESDDCDSEGLVERLRKHVGQLRSNKALWPDPAQNGRSSGSVMA
jgi:hypothetical protein